MGESIHYNDRILDRRYLLAGYGHEHNNEIIHVAATHLGRNFPTDYNGQWPYDEDAGLYIHRPLAWCSEFASWAIREGTKDFPIPLNPKRYSVIGMFNYFNELEIADHNKYWISADNYSYEDLGAIIKPG